MTLAKDDIPGSPPSCWHGSTKEEMYSSEGCGGGFCSTSEVASLNLFQLKPTGARVGSNKLGILLNPTRFIDDDFRHPLGLGWNLQTCFR